MMSHYKNHKQQKAFLYGKKSILWLTFNPGLALTGFGQPGPDWVWSCATLIIENIREKSSEVKQFVALSFIDSKYRAVTAITRDV